MIRIPSWNHEQIGNFLIAKFSDFYKDKGTNNCPALTELIHPPVVSTEENNHIANLPSASEILEVIKNFNPTKASGRMEC